MDFFYPPEAESFREDVRGWLRDYLVGDYQSLGTGTELGEDDWPLRMAWEREMGKGGWIGLSWPREFGGRGATLMETLVFAEEYARTGNGTQSALAVGYSRKNAAQQATELLKHPDVKEHLATIRAAAVEIAGIDGAEVLRRLE